MIQLINKTVLILVLFVTGTFAQSQKARPLPISDFDKWSTMLSLGMSGDGEWTSYASIYENGADTLFVKSTLGNAEYQFPKARNGHFIGKGLFACTLPDKSLQITKLSSGTVVAVPDVDIFFPLRGGEFLLLETVRDGRKEISLADREGKLFWKKAGIIDYAVDKEENSIAYSVFDGERCQLFTAPIRSKMRERLVADLAGRLENITWQAGSAFAFQGKTVDSISGQWRADRLGFYDLKGKNTKVLDAEQLATVLPNRRISLSGRDNFEVAADGKRVFFGVEKMPVSRQLAASDVQVWNSSDKRVYAARQYGEWDFMPVLTQWDVDSGSIQMLGDSINTMAILAGRDSKVLVYDGRKYLPSNMETAPRDLYLRDIASGRTELFLEKYSGEAVNLCISPGGKYIAYFREGDWWSYSISQNTHVRASHKEEGSLGRRDFDFAGAPEPAAGITWTPGDAKMLYCDQYDIWAFDPETRNRNRLTKGKESRMEYRLYDSTADIRPHFQNSGVVDLAKGVVVKAVGVNNGSCAYHMLFEDRIKKLVSSESWLSAFKYSGDKKNFSYKEQHFDRPPRIMFHEGALGKATVAVATNTQHDKYQLGKSKMISYELDGMKRNAVLLYPAGYDPDIKYPMVVHVYEKQAVHFNLYVNPSMYNQMGFNPSLLTSQGYFVLLPDIHYKTGQVGFSATACTVAATEKAVTLASIDPDRIGLMGASFGGYETSFIMTQTAIFAAAVAGSSMSDFVSGSLAMHPNTISSDMWRYVSHQPRMGSSLYENFEGYLANSPIRHAQSVTAPLLLWAGTEDGQVPPAQSMEMYLALRELGKEATLLLYEGEMHAMEKKRNQLGLTEKVLQWFGYYLKGEPRPAWTVPSQM